MPEEDTLTDLEKLDLMLKRHAAKQQAVDSIQGNKKYIGFFKNFYLLKNE